MELVELMNRQIFEVANIINEHIDNEARLLDYYLSEDKKSIISKIILDSGKIIEHITK